MDMERLLFSLLLLKKSGIFFLIKYVSFVKTLISYI